MVVVVRIGGKGVRMERGECWVNGKTDVCGGLLDCYATLLFHDGCRRAGRCELG